MLKVVVNSLVFPENNVKTSSSEGLSWIFLLSILSIITYNLFLTGVICSFEPLASIALKSLPNEYKSDQNPKIPSYLT